MVPAPHHPHMPPRGVGGQLAPGGNCHIPAGGQDQKMCTRWPLISATRTKSESFGGPGLCREGTRPHPRDREELLPHPGEKVVSGHWGTISEAGCWSSPPRGLFSGLINERAPLSPRQTRSMFLGLLGGQKEFSMGLCGLRAKRID
jgi:hypothetical protein